MKAWFEHMLEIDAAALPGRENLGRSERSDKARPLYSQWLIKGNIEAILKEKPELAELWRKAKMAHLYGRPLAFYEQLKLNLAAVRA